MKSTCVYAVVRVTNVTNVVYVSCFEDLCNDVCQDIIADTMEDHSVVELPLPEGWANL